MNWTKYTKYIVTIAGILWLVGRLSGWLSDQGAFISLGIISIALGLQNLIILNLVSRKNYTHPKITQLIEKHGSKGILYYGFYNILFFLIIGIILVVAGWFFV